MVKLIGILVLAGQLSVAVETDSGFAEAAFDNSPSGVEQLIAFAEKAVGEPEHGVHLVLGWLNDNDNLNPITEKLTALGIGHGIATPDNLNTAAEKHGVPANSSKTVILSFKDRFPFLRGNVPR